MTVDPGSLSAVRLISERTLAIKLPTTLTRPAVGPDAPATVELVNWGIRVYGFSWIRHLGTLLKGILILKSSGNTPSTIVVARAAYELSAHAYYVQNSRKA